MNFDWDEHYKKDGKSGDPDKYKISRDWKKNIIKKYYDFSKDSIIDIGCGDLQFWDGSLPKYYTGVDISPIIIQKNKEKYPESTFIISNAANQLNISSNVVMCFDMLWHIIEDEDYIKILNNIKGYSNKYVIIYTWGLNPFNCGISKKLFITLVKFKRTHKLNFNTVDDGGYQKYRDFLSIALPIFKPEFKLITTYNNTHWKEGTMYIFEKSVINH